MLVARALRTCSRLAVASRGAARRGLLQSAVAAARASGSTTPRGVHIAALYRTPASAGGQPRGPAGASNSADATAAAAAAGSASIPPLSNAHLIVTPPPASESGSDAAAAMAAAAGKGPAFVIEPVDNTADSTAAAEEDGEEDGPDEGDADGELQPWYAQGLKFGCTACGKCCTGRGGVVRVNEQEILALSQHLGLTYQQFGRKYLQYDRDEARFHLRDRPERRDTDGACVFLDGKTCSVYAARPAQCRTFPFWPRFVESKDKWDELGARRCEGVNHPNGRVWSAAEVYAQSQIQTLHDSGENYTYDEMHGVLEQMQAAERAAHNEFVRTALGAQQPASVGGADADAEAEAEVDPSSDAAIEAAVAADALARAEAAAILAQMPLEIQVDAKGNVVSSTPVAPAASAAPKTTTN